ncbi:hypothetical protein EJB05_08331, partial [Eragrostis curvula]
MAASMEVDGFRASSGHLLGFSTEARWKLPSFPCFFKMRRPEPIPDCKPLNAEQLKRHRQESLRAMRPGHLERLAIDRRLVTECLRHYNSMHPHAEYEAAPGEVTRYIRLQDGFSWTHGNFVARKRSCFPFLLPAPRTIFFFELLLVRNSDFHTVVTCTPLLDEPVTEGYSILGLPIWWGTRRNGKRDCICKTCYCRFDSRDKSPACGHNNAERVCDARCAMVDLVCCIHSLENLHMATVNTCIATATDYKSFFHLCRHSRHPLLHVILYGDQHIRQEAIVFF